MDISIEKPPPKPPHNNLEKKNIPEASPMTDLANNFRSLSSSTSTIKVENDTPSRMKLSFNSSNENMAQNDDLAIDLNPAKLYSTTESNHILQKTHSEDTKRYTKVTRRPLFTKRESKFNKLRRLNSCGNQLPRNDERSIGRKSVLSKNSSIRSNTSPSQAILRGISKTVDSKPIHEKLNTSQCESETDRLFEIAIRSRSCSRHRSDSITPLRKHSSAKSNALEPDDISPPCSPLRLNTSSINQNRNVDEFFDRFSDDGFMEDDDEVQGHEDEEISDLENSNEEEHQAQVPIVLPNPPVLQTSPIIRTAISSKNTVSSTPTRFQCPQPSNNIEISPLVAPLLAKNRFSKTPTKFSTPNSMAKLLNGKIHKNSKKSTRRGLFQEQIHPKTPKLLNSPSKIKTPKSILVSTPRSRSKTPSKRKFCQISTPTSKISKQKFLHISDSPKLSKMISLDSPEKCSPKKSSPIKSPSMKRFMSPDTPSKIRCRRRKLSYSRTKSQTYNILPLKPIDQNVLNSPIVQSSIGTKNYRCSTNPDEQEKVKMSLDKISSFESKFSGNHQVRKLDLETVNGRHPQLTYITGSTLANLIKNRKNQQNLKNLNHSPFKVLDCRYPYEYQGGHIENAINIPTIDILFNEFFNPETSKHHQYPPQDTVLIFHCEFSSERAPKMMKKIREIDRSRHKYPNLKFPELYLLKDGYKDFFAKFRNFCDGGYVPMLDSGYKQEFDNFRKMREKSKTYGGSELVKVGGRKGKRKLF